MTVLSQEDTKATQNTQTRGDKIPVGYKLSDLGVIPEDWKFIPFGSVSTLRKTKIDTRVTGEKIFCVELEHIAQCEGSLEGNTFTTKKSSIKARFYKGDILFGRLRAYLRKYWLADRAGVASTEIWPIIPNAKITTSEYIFYLIQTDRFIEAASVAYGTHMPRSDWNTISKLNIALPPLHEQKAIAAALSDIDTLITNLNRLIAKKRAIKQAAMQQLLTGKLRLPGFTGEWELKRLGDVCEINKGTIITEQEARSGNIPVIAGGKQPSYFHNCSNRIGKTITISASGASAGYVSFFQIPIFASDCSTISERKNFAIEYIYYQLLLSQENIYKMQTGGAQPHVHPSDLKTLLIEFPELCEQTAIANILSDMDDEIAALEQQRDKTRNLKQGMMQELLTGRIRLV